MEPLIWMADSMVMLMAFWKVGLIKRVAEMDSLTQMEQMKDSVDWMGLWMEDVMVAWMWKEPQMEF